jgi:hypothetical protein
VEAVAVVMAVQMVVAVVLVRQIWEAEVAVAHSLAVVLQEGMAVAVL